MQLEEAGSDGEPNGIKETDLKAEDQLRPEPPNDSESKPITEREIGGLPCCYTSTSLCSPCFH